GTFLKTEIDYLVLGDLIVRRGDNAAAVRGWRRDNRPEVRQANDRLLRDYRATRLGGNVVFTDKVDRKAGEAVAPLFPEHQFFLDELEPERVKGANVLEVNPRSGAVSIALARAGAKRVTAVEGDPRARLFIGHNAFLNGCVDRLVLRDGGDDCFSAVRGERFDLIVADALLLAGGDREASRA